MAVLWLLSCVALLGVSSGQGEPASLPELSIEPRIINGLPVPPGASIWHVTLSVRTLPVNGVTLVYWSFRGQPVPRWGDWCPVDADPSVFLQSRGGRIFCGGVLIRRNWVLTAAHCNVTTSSRVLLGLRDLRLPGFIQEMRIARVFTHPMFDPDTHHSDIALLKLSRLAHYNSRVFPLRLPLVYEPFLPRTSCKIWGWGYSHFNGIIRPDQLQEAPVAIVDDRTCNRVYPNLSPDVMICAWGRDVGPNHGDSGGSLACLKNGFWTLAGILSYSRSYGLTRIPFVATRVTEFIPWIEEVLAHN